MTSAEATQERIVDVVLDPRSQRRTVPLWQRMVVPALLALLVHVGLLVLGHRRGPTLEPWSAELALRVHRELSRLHVTEVVPPPEAPPAPTPPPAEPPQEPVAEPAPAAPAPQRAPRRAAKAPSPPAPAQAAQVVTAAPDSDGPIDLSTNTFVSGRAAAFVGGASARGGVKSAEPIEGPTQPAAPPAPPAAPTVTVPVKLGPAGFDCPWPPAAVTHDIYQAVVTLKVLVDSDGRTQRVRIENDPGYGLGAAAASCAKGTRFTPAQDSAGRSVRAWSPPIHVRFVR